MLKPIDPAIKQAIRDKYAFPGGYPMHIVTSDGGCLCMDCCKSEWRNIAHSIMHNISDDWQAIAAVINWEDPSLLCDHCGKHIESAYSD